MEAGDAGSAIARGYRKARRNAAVGWPNCVYRRARGWATDWCSGITPWPPRFYDARMTATTSRVILCPGQGAQFVGMGKAWYEKSAAARRVFDRADEVLGNRLGIALSRLCFEGLAANGAERLNQTDVSQPAIYVAGVACWHGLLEQWGILSGPNAAKEAGVVATAGLSLGEYTALHVAGGIGFEEGLELVTLRGRAMQDAADAIRLSDGSVGSGMVAIIGAEEAQVHALCEKAGQGDVLVPANFNAPGQIVISGSIAACRRAVEFAGEMGMRATALAVAGAFHSSLMQPAAERLRKGLDATTVHTPACAVLSNVTGKPHEQGNSDSMGQSIRARLVEQLTHPVRWEQDCQWLAKEFGGKAEFHELAPGKTLAGLYRRIDKGVKVDAHDEPKELAAV